jgi:hypothetical protein
LLLRLPVMKKKKEAIQERAMEKLNERRRENGNLQN